MTQPADGTPARGRGRPPRYSREKIIEAATALATSDPATPLTVKRVSAAIGSAPMALYRYFPDRDDLLHAVADAIMGEMRITAPPGGSWQDQLRTWMTQSREQLVPYPQLLPYMAGTREPAWLPSFVVLGRMLRPLSLRDEDLALAVVLVGSTVVGHALLETRRRPPIEVLPRLRTGLAHMTPDDRELVAPVLEELPAAFDRLYDTVITRTIDSIAALAATPTRPGPAPLRFSDPGI